jgi:serine/threonine-protein kinase RsbW
MNAPDTASDIEGIVTLHLPARFGYLRIARQTTLDFCARAALSEFRSAQLEMAVDEACANIIEHSYGGEKTDNLPGRPAGIQLNLIQHRDRVEVEIHDFGRGFDLEGTPSVSPDQYMKDERSRGLGLYIIRNFVDDVTYERNTPAGNRLRLIKRLF